MPPRKVVTNPIPATYPGLIDGKGMPEDKWQACKEILEAVYKVRLGSRRLADIFREFPDRELYEDYYQAIPEPECLDHIAAQLGAQAYPAPEAFFKQLHLVFLNAKHYNEDESTIWSDAQRLEEQIQRDWATKAETQVFASSDPYHNSPVKPGRKPKGPYIPPGKPATPVPEASPKVRTPIPEPASAPSPDFRAAPPPDVAPTPPASSATISTPLRRHDPVHVAPSPAPIVAPAASSPAPLPPISRTPSAVSNYRPPPSPSPSEKIRLQEQYDADQAVIAARDATLPRWPGPSPVLPGNPAPGGIHGSGWWGEGAPEYEATAGGPAQWPRRIQQVLRAVTEYRNVQGERPAEVLQLLPAVADIPYLSFNTPLSFENIIASANRGRYNTLRDFDLDMARLFEKGRRWFHDGSAEYGKVLLLQRLHNALTAPFPLPLPASGIPEPSPTLFASLPAGPGNARSLHEATQEIRAGAAEEQVGFGITTFRVGSKDRIFTEEARHKGQAYRLGDFVHLINPDDATRPIIGQIFKTFVPTNRARTHHVSVCWYYRPEQTVHPVNQEFYEHEVFKTGQFCDHPVEDILQKISIQFFVKYVRGRPREGEYYPGWPVYVCNSRFNHRDYNIVRIKNWNSCIPDELRQTEFMSIVPFDRIVEARTVASPFVRGVEGPGFIGEPKKPLGGGADDDDDDDDDKPKKPARARAPPAPITPAAPPVAAPRPSAPPVSAYRPPSVQPVAVSQPSRAPSRTIASVVGGQQAMDATTTKEMLPPKTGRLFERDSRGQVLWFSGPPLTPGAIPIPQQTTHSLEYLSYLAKRKRGDEDARSRKAGRWSVPEEGGEAVKVEAEDETRGQWWAEGQSEDQVLASLKSLVDGA